MKTFISSLVFFILLISSNLLLAHGRYILPSHTVLSGDSAQSITLISSISNDIFHHDRALGDNGKGIKHPSLDGLFKVLQPTVISPDGKKSEASWQAFSRLSATDVKLVQNGTYRISLNQPTTMMTTFKKADGSPGRVFGKSAQLPEKVTNVVKRTTSSRVETFVSFNEQNKKAIQPTGNGLELSGETHPNDLFTQEEASFQLFYNGQPVTQKTEIQFVKEGTRHRNKRNEIKVMTDSSGKFNVKFDEAGFYLMEADLTLPGAKGTNIDFRHLGLYVTLEVFPQ
ncbi:DUF4198 domain-containing protein [Aliikangiella sp. IMCC44359]|uniref:DUF4198 domain-containing protein n=1 Tax=Aliikangiella sp. IMCC44359 TaxID=3459125 RepID=UPI00403ADE84